MDEITRIGIIGISEGNGHPFSFSAIINGYSDPDLADSGWQVIYDYVRRRDKSEFGIDGFQITHAWTQDDETTKKLCKACLIPHAVSSPGEMIANVDAVILARDDYENHFSMAMPFLEAGLHVFVDKPLSLDVDELQSFMPYLRSGKLMSCAAMRYARELDEVRSNLARYGKLKLVRGAVLNSWEKYGVHLIEAILSVIKNHPVWINAVEAEHMSVCMGMDDGLFIQIDAMGECVKTFRTDFWGTKDASSHEITDNFSMFRRMLWHFCRAIKTGEPAISPEETMEIMRILMAGRVAKQDKRKVYLHEMPI